MHQSAIKPRSKLPAMASEIGILSVERDGKDSLFVTFTGGTLGAYVAEELLALRPIRELAHEPGEFNPPPNPQLRLQSIETVPLSGVPQNGNRRERKS